MTQPDLFPAPSPAGAPGSAPTEWSELTWTNGKTYRWRVHPVGWLAPDHYVDRAPAPHRWELELHDPAGVWWSCRFYARRDAIWNHVRDEALNLVGADHA